jgi:hypothetical protein
VLSAERAESTTIHLAEQRKNYLFSLIKSTSIKLELFSFAVLSTAKEISFYLCALCASSEAGGKKKTKIRNQICKPAYLALA